MSYTFAEAGKDAARIENFLQRLGKAREIFGLVSEAEAKVAYLDNDVQKAKKDLKAVLSRVTVANTLADQKLAALSEVVKNAEAEANLAQKDARGMLNALATEVALARKDAEKTRHNLNASFENLGTAHQIRMEDMKRAETGQKERLAEAQHQLREIVKKISPSGD